MKRAFTLIELLVVIAIMGTMVTVGVISFTTGKGSTQLFAAARDVMATVRRARSVALVTQKPVVVEYANEGASDDIAAHAKITITSEKLFDSSEDDGNVETLDGRILDADGNEVDERKLKRNETATVEKKSSKKGDAATTEDDEGGETLEDMLSPDKIPEDVLDGVKIKVLNDDEVLQTEVQYKSRISIFSTADSISRSYGGTEEKKTVDKEKGVEEATESPVKVVFAANGTVEPAHKIWIYMDGSKPENGLCIEVDRFGNPKCSDLEGK